MRIAFLIAGFVLFCTRTTCYANDSTSVLIKTANFPNKFFGKASSKAASLESQLDKQTEKFLKRLAKQEAKLKMELQKADPVNSAYLFINDPVDQYGQLSQRVKSDSARTIDHTRSEYLPYADSLESSLAFLKGNPQILSAAGGGMPGDAQTALSNLRGLGAKMQDAELAKQYIIERKEQIRQYILMHANLPPGVSNIYNDYNKQLYYYQSQLNEYKDILNDPDKMLKTVLNLLNKFPAFGVFMQKNSYLSGIMGVQDDYTMQSMLPGMQTRDMVNQVVQTQVSGGGANAASALSQNLESAQGQLEGLKDKLSSLGQGGNNTDLPPNFKPNTQKSKSFLKRLELGANMQTVHGNYYFPVTTDLGLSLGFKMNDKSVIGLGASYKIGWGKDISHISLSSQGAGLRSFLDILIKRGFYATGGYEYNYQPLSGSDLGYLKSWQQSGLIGITKSVSVSNKFFKKTKIQLLWDLLSYQQIPKAQPIKFRIGYSF